jgi:hypothetical protein
MISNAAFDSSLIHNMFGIPILGFIYSPFEEITSNPN